MNVEKSVYGEKMSELSRESSEFLSCLTIESAYPIDDEPLKFGRQGDDVRHHQAHRGRINACRCGRQEEKHAGQEDNLN